MAFDIKKKLEVFFKHVRHFYGDEITYTFIRFLYSNKIYGLFFYNFSDTKNRTWLAKYNLMTHPTQFIKFAFDWKNTPQGFDYWNKMDIVWTREFRKYLKNKVCC